MDSISLGIQITKTFIYPIVIVSLGDNINKCECGCGQEVDKRFVQGHNILVNHFSGSVKGKRPDVSERNRKTNPLRKGENHWNWKGGITKRNMISEEYKARRKAVFKKDNYTCQNCGKHGGHMSLQAHHIKEWVNYPELRFDVNNGKTLCNKCHNKTKRLNQWKKK